MKFLLTTFILISFLSIAVFSVFGMHSNMQNHDSGCIAALAQGLNCPKQGSALDYFTFNIDAFKYFSTAILTLILIITGIGFGILVSNLNPPRLNYIYYNYKNLIFLNFSPKRKLIRWLAFHENSPAIF